jgi:hypothetical protein
MHLRGKGGAKATFGFSRRYKKGINPDYVAPNETHTFGRSDQFQCLQTSTIPIAAIPRFRRIERHFNG